jgi:hypothetical protein
MKPFLLTLLFTAANASAGLITLNATNSGFYNGAGGRVAANHATGWYVGQGNAEIRNFFTFDLSTVSGTITTATLRLSSVGTSGSLGYTGSDLTETYTVFDVSTSPTRLVNGTGGVAAFNDLGTGTAFGSVVATRPVGPSFIEPTFREVVLNAAALAFLQSNLGPNQIAFGGALTSLTRGSLTESLFNSTSGQLTRQLILTTEDASANPGGSSVPEPATMLLAGAALLALRAAKCQKS